MELKNIIEGLLKSTERPGIENLLAWMDENGFYTSPCSGGNHLAKKGGLAEHSLNVLETMGNLYAAFYAGNPNMLQKLMKSCTICALLHDLGKTGDYGKPGYVPNMIKDGRPTKAAPEQKYKQSEAKPFETNKDLYPVDHEVRSVKIASKFIDLTEEEELAILWHNGLYGNFRYQIQGNETPLYMLLHFADMWASRVMEVENDGKDSVQNTGSK